MDEETTGGGASGAHGPRGWAIDFTGPCQPVDGRYPYLLGVRDLASGQQLLGLPVEEATAETAATALASLFMIHGAPLVLKSDNGSPFTAGLVGQLAHDFGVELLFSPPGMPRYNGAIEASIGSLKKRTQHAAYLAGHAGLWTSADLDRARALANRVARPRGPGRRNTAPARNGWQKI